MRFEKIYLKDYIIPPCTRPIVVSFAHSDKSGPPSQAGADTSSEADNLSLNDTTSPDLSARSSEASGMCILPEAELSAGSNYKYPLVPGHVGGSLQIQIPTLLAQSEHSSSHDLVSEHTGNSCETRERVFDTSIPEPGPLRYPYAPAAPRAEVSGPRSPQVVHKTFTRTKKQYIFLCISSTLDSSSFTACFSPRILAPLPRLHL